MPRPLAGTIALVAGATRGAGRAIAVELARAGAFVYASGRSSSVHGRSEIDRPETIEQTGELVAAVGDGTAVVVDHTEIPAVGALIDRIREERGRLDLLVNDMFGGDRYAQFDKPLWEHDLHGGWRMMEMGVHSHLITAALALPLMLGGDDGLIVEMTDGFGVTEERWRDALAEHPGFAISETPTYVARGIAALAADPDKTTLRGSVLTARQLADRYDLTDVDGSRPDCWGQMAAEAAGLPATVDEFR